MTDFLFFERELEKEGKSPQSILCCTYGNRRLDFDNDSNTLNEAIRSARRDCPWPDYFIILCPSYNLNNCIDFFENDTEYKILQRLPLECKTLILAYTYPYQESKLYNLDGSDNSDYNFINDWPNLAENGLAKIASERNLVEKSPSGTLFLKPSETYSKQFIRTAKILTCEPFNSLITFGLLPKLPEKISTIYIDTASIMPVAYALSVFLQNLNAENIFPKIVSFESYYGVEHVRIPSPEDTLVIISSSTSGNLQSQIKEGSSATVITLFMASNSKDHEYLCNLLDHKLYDDQLENDIKTISSETKAIKLVSQEFRTEAKPPQPVLLKLFHINQKQKNFHARFYTKTFFKVYSQVQTALANSVKLSIDEEMLLNDTKFRNWIEGIVERQIPYSVQEIIYTDDTNSKELAETIHEQLKKFHKQNISLLKYNDTIQFNNKYTGAVLVVSAVIGSGNKILSISRALRKVINEQNIHYIVGVALPTSTQEFENLKNSLTLGPKGIKYSLHNWQSINVGNDKQGRAWEKEENFLNDFNEDDHLPKSIITRRDIVNSAGVNGLTEDNIFLYENSEDFKLNDHFVYWNDGPQKDANNADAGAVIATINDVLNNARNDKSLSKEDQLFSDVYQHTVISPDNFTRFNDGIIQASLIRMAHQSELDYRDSQKLSREMVDVIVNIVSSKGKAGAAKLEILMALATQRIQLHRNFSVNLAYSLISIEDLSDAAKFLTTHFGTLYIVKDET